jgi:hypothetical protein
LLIFSAKFLEHCFLFYLIHAFLFFIQFRNTHLALPLIFTISKTLIVSILRFGNGSPNNRLFAYWSYADINKLYYFVLVCVCKIVYIYMHPKAVFLYNFQKSFQAALKEVYQHNKFPLYQGRLKYALEIDCSSSEEEVSFLCLDKFCN